MTEILSSHRTFRIYFTNCPTSLSCQQKVLTIDRRVCCGILASTPCDDLAHVDGADVLIMINHSIYTTPRMSVSRRTADTMTFTSGRPGLNDTRGQQEAGLWHGDRNDPSQSGVDKSLPQNALQLYCYEPDGCRPDACICDADITSIVCDQVDVDSQQVVNYIDHNVTAD